ncbi:MAG: ParB/RepB/Spo0J family partition protein [Sediminimonas qiaohouensis]|uniref:ParB/RepB/Spo0J family partition protein n=1 Tax=Sediminimonas qiaohouensis TaxID=552061 RepID=A0A7C9HB00_9RHOB|nr:ParB/RepB/Spo0J family partition protein [Sediminimonas qiaohouensis]MTJ04604.1 ParB/RepB/Spo0J family partition protein [Sediminimonas qiaohouensis]
MSEKKHKNRGLGRGLSALMADVSQAEEAATPAASSGQADRIVPIEKVHPNPDQPRRNFTTSDLEELAASIRQKGVIQPLIVRARAGEDGSFEIVAGERRWRAAQMAKLHELPVLVRDFDDTEVLEIAIIENIQRADLNPIEEAAGYRQLMEKFGHTQEKLSDVLGKSRSHIANLVRLLGLPDEVQTYLRDNKLSAGHARALITADDPVALAKKVVSSGLSVRETENLVRKAATDAKTQQGGQKAAGKGQKPSKDADTKALEGDLSAALGMRVSIQHDENKESGRVTIGYSTLDELDELCRMLSATR